MVVRRPTIEFYAFEFFIYSVRFEKTPTDYELNKKRHYTAKNCKTAITRQSGRATKTTKKKTALFTETAANAKNEKAQTASRQKT